MVLHRPERLRMFRIVLLCGLLIPALDANASGQHWTLEYTPSHRATFEQVWNYRFPNYQSTRWVIALRYPPELAWSQDVQGTAELLTSKGWKPFKEVREESPEKRRMLIMDYPHNDPKLHGGFTVRTRLTATICDQELKKSQHPRHVAPLHAEKKASYLRATHAFDFKKPEVKAWLDEHAMWKGKHEDHIAFGRRVQKELRSSCPTVRRTAVSGSVVRFSRPGSANAAARRSLARPSCGRTRFRPGRSGPVGRQQQEPRRPLLGGILRGRRRLGPLRHERFRQPAWRTDRRHDRFRLGDRRGAIRETDRCRDRRLAGVVGPGHGEHG